MAKGREVTKKTQKRFALCCGSTVLLEQNSVLLFGEWMYTALQNPVVKLRSTNFIPLKDSVASKVKR